MRLVTRCPACATTFKVVRDQLRISDGWVRCGRCSEVFDATLDLHETDEEGVPISPPPASAQAAAPVSGRPQAQENLLPLSSAGAGLPAMSWPAADLLDLGPKPPSLPTAPAAEPQDPVAIPTLDGSELDEEPWFEESEFDAKAHSAPLDASAAALAAALSSVSLSTSPTSSTSPARRQEPSFTPSLTSPSPIEEAVNAQLQKALRRERIKALRLERAQQKERERAEQKASAPAGKEDVAAVKPEPKPEPVPEALLLEAPSAPVGLVDEAAGAQPASTGRLRRVLIALGCLLALALLVLQVVRHERDTLAAREPRLLPVLKALCAWTQCEISALRQIASITIDGASFSRENEGDGYRLVFTLRNGARMPLAMPSIELTLLDTQERALVRRVLSPAQFGAPAVLGPAAERSASLPLRLAGSEAEGLAPVAGYRLVAFYP
jgi:predicted Zn finger-like uncharacterized protein